MGCVLLLGWLASVHPRLPLDLRWLIINYNDHSLFFNYSSKYLFLLKILLAKNYKLINFYINSFLLNCSYLSYSPSKPYKLLPPLLLSPYRLLLSTYEASISTLVIFFFSLWYNLVAYFKLVILWFLFMFKVVWGRTQENADSLVFVLFSILVIIPIFFATCFKRIGRFTL